jgi:hypothetical protein
MKVSSDPNSETLIQELVTRHMLEVEVQRRLKVIEEIGPDKYKDGDTIKWRMQFAGSDKVYVYAALRIDGRYYTTAQYNSVKSWEELVMEIANSSIIPPQFIKLHEH